MSLNDPLASLFSMINNAERVGKKNITSKPVNKLMVGILDKLIGLGYVEKYEIVADSKGNYIQVVLKGTINKCGVIKPRFPVALEDYEKFEKRYLPAKNLGVLLLSTNKGILTHEEAKHLNIGGRLLAYCY